MSKLAVYEVTTVDPLSGEESTVRMEAADRESVVKSLVQHDALMKLYVLRIYHFYRLKNMH